MMMLMMVVMATMLMMTMMTLMVLMTTVTMMAMMMMMACLLLQLSCDHLLINSVLSPPIIINQRHSEASGWFLCTLQSLVTEKPW